MQTIPKFSTKPNGDSHTVLWGDEIVGKIDFNITTLKWEYSRYSQYPAVASGNTAEECLEAAETDHTAQYAEPLVEVIAIHHATTQPTYKAQGWGTWKQHGPGNSTVLVIAPRSRSGMPMVSLISGFLQHSLARSAQGVIASIGTTRCVSSITYAGPNAPSVVLRSQ